MSVSAFISRLGTKFPTARALESQLSSSSFKNLDDLRSQVWRLRAEYWARRMDEIPGVFKQAKLDAFHVRDRLKDPKSWTWGDLVSTGIFGLQVTGAFAVGTALGRGNLLGYDVDDHRPDPEFEEKMGSHGHH